jgi:glycoprotein endo-alpha-1,2-mannosidase
MISATLSTIIGFLLLFKASLTIDSLEKVQFFYYLWYGNPEIDGSYKHWNHEVLPHWETRINEQFPRIGRRFQPPEELHSPYYPYLGPYSSRDPVIIQAHFELIRNANVKVIIVSWWGQPNRSETTDTQGVNTDETLEILFEVADQWNGEILISFHLEPYPQRSIESIRSDIEYLNNKYGHHSSICRSEGKLVYYVYDSYHIPAFQWRRLLTNEGDLTIRQTRLDGIFIGLWLMRDDGRELLHGGFDGIYTYFASEEFSYGSTLRNWPRICQFCHENDMYCILSVGPGYNDTLIRPWNAHNARKRE